MAECVVIGILACDCSMRRWLRGSFENLRTSGRYSLTTNHQPQISSFPSVATLFGVRGLGSVAGCPASFRQSLRLESLRLGARS